MKRKLLSLALALALCLSLAAPTLAAESDFQIENGILTKYTGSGGAVTIPSGVTVIGEHAFSSCTNLTNVTIPSSVTTIGVGAFNNCTSLTSVTIPSGVTTIGYEAFEGCTSLTSVTIPSSVTTIGDSAFYSCTGLTSVTIPSGVTTIGYEAFEGCTSLTSVTIPSSVTEIGGLAFYDTPWQKNQGAFHIVNGILLRYQGEGGAVTIPSGVTAIGKSAFLACRSLTSLTIPSSVTTIDKYAFNGCTSLTSITIPSSVTTIGWGAFSYCKNLTSLTIPSTVTTIGDSAFLHCTSLTSVTISSGVTEIGKYAFSSCASLSSVTIPSSVTRIGYEAFADCPNLTIYGAAGSAAQTYAAENDIPFVANQPTVVPPSGPTAYPSTQSILVNGQAVEFQCYALKDAKGNDTNYIKLRDLASVLNGTGSQFEVTWDGSVNLVPGQPYTPNGSEMSTPFSGPRAYEAATAGTKLNNVSANLEAIVLKDDAGGAYTYYKLRDLGKALGFTVDWSADQGIFIQTK